MAAHETTLEIDGEAVNLAARRLLPARLSLRLRGASSLTLTRKRVILGDDDPHLGKPVVLKIDGVTRFAGVVADRDRAWSPDFGWHDLLQCRGLRDLGDKVPFTDSNTKMDSARYNSDPEDYDKIDARLGRTVGQIIEDVLTMQENAEALDAMGIGGYTSLDPPTLPDETLADLAALTVIPGRAVSIGGQGLLSANDGLLTAWAPNHAQYVRPDGVIRYHDVRDVDELVLTFGDCSQRVMPGGLSRSTSECYQRVLVRGEAVALAKLLTTATGTLIEDFAWGTHSNAEAKAIWKPEDFRQDKDARSQGTCSVTDTTHVVLTSNPTSQTWGANEWDQANRRGVLYVIDEALPGVNYAFSSRIVANTAKSSGGTSTVTLETPLPATSYTKYFIYGLSSGASLVWRKYQAADEDVRAALARRFTSPQPYVNAGATSITQESYPIASICRPLTPGAPPPYLEYPMGILSIDPSDGTFLLAAPTWTEGVGAPADVRILAAVNTGVLQAIKPDSGYEGTSHDVEGLEHTLVVTVRGWRDPANTVNMQAYAQDLLDAVKDAVIEGSVTIHDLYTPALDFGVGISIEGSGYATGWEGANVPVVAVDVTWNSRSASHWTTTLQVSNRRASYAVEAYLRPERRMGDGTLGFADPPSLWSPPFTGGFQGGGFQGEAFDAGDSSSYGAMEYGGDDMSYIDFKTGRDTRSARDRTSPRDPRSARDDASPLDPESSGARSYAAREAEKTQRRQAAKARREGTTEARRDASRSEAQARAERDATRPQREVEAKYADESAKQEQRAAAERRKEERRRDLRDSSGRPDDSL